MDAALALIPVFIFLASVSTIGEIGTSGSMRMLSSGRIAQDVLVILEYNGILINVSKTYQTGVARGNSTLINQSMMIFNSSISALIPDYLGYNATFTTPRGTFTVARGNISSAPDIMSVWSTTVGPELGWAGFAWFKRERVNFTDVNRTTTSTIWNFHNYLSNYYSIQWRFCLTGWGGPTGATNIPISTPPNATLHNAYYYLGARTTSGTPYDASFYLNGGVANTTGYPSDYTLVNTQGSRNFYNSRRDVSVGTTNSSGVLGPGVNNMWLLPTASCSSSDNMPWFSFIANYTSAVPTPENVDVATFNLPNAEGAANTSSPSITWADSDSTWASRVAPYSDGVPYRITSGGSFPSNMRRGSTITVVKNYSIPSGVTVLDGSIDLNLVAAVDATRVEVFDNSASQWVTIFNSFDINGIDYTDVTYPFGYGNLPGKLNIDPSYITPGSDNSVRVTLWDYVPSTDYDFVGILDSTITVSYTPVLLTWNNFVFNSHQSTSNDYYQDRAFNISADAQEALLFVGVGLDTRRLNVSIRNTTSSFIPLYDDTVVPYMLNLGELDAGLSANQRILTTNTSTPSNYTFKEGSYTVRVQVIAASNGWESGDTDQLGSTNANSELFSGTKVSVLYPEFLSLEIAESYNATASEAEEAARKALSAALGSINVSIPWNSSTLLSEASYVSGEPLPTYVSLRIWYQQ